jgi:hypothetical protein
MLNIIERRINTNLKKKHTKTETKTKKKKNKQTNKQKKKRKRGSYMFTLSDRRLPKPLVLSQTECSVVLFSI